jgi:dienelactone hydrolase
MTDFIWTDSACSGGVCERGFRVEHRGRSVPGVLWMPADTQGLRPLVLLGHGGSSHKRGAKILSRARLLAGARGCWAAAIDGPVHGDRGPVTDTSHPAYAGMWRNARTVSGMAEDWTAVLDACLEHRGADGGGIDAGRVGFWGKSMGCMFGIPFVVSEPRVRAAVFGKAGMTGSSAARSGIEAHFRTAAPRVSIPLLFTMQWDDERFDRTGQLELFDLLGSENKRMHTYPGLHGDDGPEAEDTEADFLMRYLAWPPAPPARPIRNAG